MKMLLSVAALAVLLSSLTGCSSCGDRNPCDDDRAFGLGMFHKKHFGFGRNNDCDACGASPVLDGGISQVGGCGCGNTGSAMMPVSTSGCGCNSGASAPMMPVSMNSGAPGLPAGTIVTESVPTPAPAMGGTFRGTNPGMVMPGPE